MKQRERILLCGNINAVSAELKQMLATYGDDEIGWIAPIVRFNKACDTLLANLKKVYGGVKYEI